MKKLLLLFSSGFLFFSQLQSQTVSLTPYVSGFTNPIDIKNCGDDRLFVAERNGRIRVVNGDGTLRPTPFLDIISKVSGLDGEEGFLGICFSPNYKADGKFYVSYTAYSDAQLISVIEQYQVSQTDSNIADISSGIRIITVNQPYTNHKGGNIMFGRDGYLYIFWGDGGSGGDPFGNGQNKTVLLAKILRIDVSNVSVAEPYAIPPTNPFADSSGNIRKEIWAYGLRNPFRASFDPVTNDLWIGDVGQNAYEEIDLELAGDKGGHNYGWNRMEGFSCYSPAVNCDSTGMTPPIYDYPHPEGYCVIGGHVYRSVQSRKLWGTYIFADYVLQWIDGFKQINGKIIDSVVRMVNDGSGGGPISFGVDKYYDQYMCRNGNSTIFKLNDADPNPFPKAYLSASKLSDTNYILKAFEGRNISYQWLYEDQAISGATLPSFNATAQGVYKLVVTNSIGNKDTSDPFIISLSQVVIENFSAARIDNKKVLLTWETLSEQNSSGFELQRKFDIDTGFKDVSFVASLEPSGSSLTPIHYSYTDTPVYKGAMQYRLKQVNQNGSFSYSGIVNISAISLKLDFVISPNPAVNAVYFSTNNTDDYQYELFDMNGRKLFQNSFTGNTWSFKTGFAQSGIYYLKLRSVKSGESVVKKLILMHK
ncbi:MAG TPA: PQQ-dependent sugar dehydrogenase [Puia sp.]|nr:PQQ-dependent sugar dehydrogenase [Puia sp.]